ncbi:MAG TPA: YtxH domain-containing protein [Ferruginibacter sp.]|nr:YtxH domain-containing protein [Ferruginibacter sp.]
MNKVIIAFTSGLILGILYAPAKGKNTRNKIAHAGDSLKAGWNNITDNLADKIDSLREGVDHMADRAVEKVESTQFGSPIKEF